jgi:hypothetical protein
VAEDIRTSGGRVALGFDVVGTALRVDLEDWYKQRRAIGCDGTGCGTGQLEGNI